MRTLRVILWLCAARASAAEPAAWVDARLQSTAQFFEQALVPGQPGAVTRVEAAYPFTQSAFVRGGGTLEPLRLTLEAELSAWGRVGPRDGLQSDGDVTAAWVRGARGPVWLKLGRQVTLPGSSRYLRFDGAALGARFGPAEFEAHLGWVALPRWSLPRGAVLAGFAGDALKDPEWFAAQGRAGQWTFGAKVSSQLGARGWASLSFHEQRDAVGLAFRVFSADAVVSAASWLSLGGRLSFDAAALAVPEARLWADLTVGPVPLSLDYGYQSPALLLSRSSVLAAFGGAAWHELGAETSLRVRAQVRVIARGAAQLFEGDVPGGRGLLRLQWTPGLDGRALVLAEAGRAFVPPSGFFWFRLGARWRASQAWWLSADTSAWFYDTPVRGQRQSLTALASVEYAWSRQVKVLASGTVMSTPYAVVETQGLLRLVIELEPDRAGASL